MSPELVFWLALTTKMAVTTLFVSVATIIAERLGAAVGALVATLPVSAGPVYVFLALDHDATFISASAVASLALNTATAIFITVYVLIAQRRSLWISVSLAIAEAMGQTNNTIVVFTTDNGAEQITFPDGGVTPFKGQKGEAWEGGYRAPAVIRWPGVIRPGTVKSQLFAALDWLPTLVEIAGGPKGDGLKKQIEAGQYPGIVKTTLDGINQIDYLTGKSEKSARDYFFYYSGSTPSAVRYKNWKMYYTMAQEGATGWLLPLVAYHWTMVQNIKRDPFEQAVGQSVKTATGLGGALAAPSTAYLYDWNILPIGQQLWLKELESYNTFPPLQAAETYNLSGILEQVKKAHANAPSD